MRFIFLFLFFLSLETVYAGEVQIEQLKKIIPLASELVAKAPDLSETAENELEPAIQDEISSLVSFIYSTFIETNPSYKRYVENHTSDIPKRIKEWLGYWQKVIKKQPNAEQLIIELLEASLPITTTVVDNYCSIGLLNDLDPNTDIIFSIHLGNSVGVFSNPSAYLSKKVTGNQKIVAISLDLILEKVQFDLERALQNLKLVLAHELGHAAHFELRPEERNNDLLSIVWEEGIAQALSVYFDRDLRSVGHPNPFLKELDESGSFANYIYLLKADIELYGKLQRQVPSCFYVLEKDFILPKCITEERREIKKILGQLRTNWIGISKQEHPRDMAYLLGQKVVEHLLKTHELTELLSWDETAVQSAMFSALDDLDRAHRATYTRDERGNYWLFNRLTENMVSMLASAGNKIAGGANRCIERPRKLQKPLLIRMLEEDASVEELHNSLLRGAHVQVVDERGITPLHIVCAEGNVEKARLLLHYGADPLARDLFEERPGDNCFRNPLIRELLKEWIESRNISVTAWGRFSDL